MTSAPLTRLVRVGVVAAALAGVALTGTGPAGALPAAPQRAAPAAADAVRVRLSEVGPLTLTPDDTLRLRGTVTAPPGTGPLTVRLALHEGRLGTRPEVTAWTAARALTPDPDAVGEATAELAEELLDATREVAEVELDGPGRFEVSVDADDLRLPTRRASFGPRGLAVEVLADGEGSDDVLARETTFTIWSPRPDDPIHEPTRLSVVVPVTAAASADLGSGLDVDAELAPGGRLTRLTAASDVPGVGWLVDPALVTAVARRGGLIGPRAGELPGRPAAASSPPATSSTTARAPSPSGPAATPSTTGDDGTDTDEDAGRQRAREWTDALAASGRERDVAWLPWGDTDVAGLLAAKVPQLLGAADARSDAVVRDVMGGKPDRTWGLLSEGPVPAPALDLLTASGRSRVVVPGRTVAADDRTPDAAHRVPTRNGAVTVLAADPVVSAELAAAGTDAGGVVATQRLLADLAAITIEERDVELQVLALTPRTWSPSEAALRRTLAALASVDWVRMQRPSTLEPAAQAPLERLDRVAGPPAPGAPGSAPDRVHLRAAGDALLQFQTFAGAMREPDLVLQPGREQTLSLLSTAWRRESAARRAQARAPVTAAARQLLGGVTVVQGGPYNVLASTGMLPLQLSNRTPYDLTVVLRLQPQSGQVETPEPLRVELPARSPAHRVRLPLTTLASGDVSTVAQLNSPAGSRISPKVTLVLRVRREWESRGLIGLVTITGGLLVVGIARTVRRGRKRIRPEDVPDIDDLAVEREESERVAALVGAGVARAGTASGGTGGGSGGTGTASGGTGDAGGGTAAESGREAARALARSSVVMAAGTLVSRLLGFVRVTVLALAIGMAGASADAFSVANKIPNIVYMLVAGGVLNAVLVPQITRAARMGREGEEYVDRLLSAAIGLLALIAVAVTAAAPLLARLYAGGDVTAAQVSLSTAFAFWCLPQVFFYGLYTVWGQVLNARGAFGAYMWAPVVNNVVALAGLAAFLVVHGRVGRTGTRPEPFWQAGSVALLAGTATLGVVAQALVLWPVLRRTGFRWRPRWGWRGVGLGSASRVAAWTFAAVVVAQLGFVVTSNVLTSAGHLAADVHGERGARTGSALYDYAFLLFMLPHSLVAVSLVTALFTRLSKAAAAGDRDGVRADLSLGLRTLAVASVLATAGICSLAPVAVRLLGWNPGAAYGAMAMSVGMVAFSASYLQQRVFYAYEDARTPFLVGLPSVAVTVGGALLSARLLDPQWVLVGVGLSMSAANLLTSTLLARRLSRLLHGTDGARVLAVHARLIVAGGVAAAAAWLTVHGMLRGFGDTDVQEAGRTAAAAALFGGVVVLLGAYLAAARVLRVRELDELTGPVRRRLAPLLARFGR